MFSISKPSPAGPNQPDSHGLIPVAGIDVTPHNYVSLAIFEWASGVGPPIGGSTAFPNDDNTGGASIAGNMLAWGSFSYSCSGANKFFSGSDANGAVSMFPFHADPPPGIGLFAPTELHELHPAALSLQVDSPFEGGSSAARGRLNQPALLVHSQDPHFAGSWYSQPIELGGNQAFWQLTKIPVNHKTGGHAWLLCLQFLSGEVATYHAKTPATKKVTFPITLKLKSQLGGSFKKWPKSITLSHAP